MNREAYVIIQTALGRGASRQFPIHRVESYTTDTAIDNDADSFNIGIGDPHGELLFITDRDTEAKITMFISGEDGKTAPIFTGMVDSATFSTEDYILSLAGRDMSCLAVDSDAPAGRWRHVKPKPFLEARAAKLGLTSLSIASMREITSVMTDASETEWSFWYRLVRQRGLFMWTGPLGTLYVDRLHYDDNASHLFGIPVKGNDNAGWQRPISVVVHSSKMRSGQVWVYGEEAKTGRPFYAKGVDTSISSWRRKPIHIITSSNAKSNTEAKKDADEEVFESIVGAYEIQLVIPDSGQTIQQNRMARLMLPAPLDHLNGLYFIVGVSRGGGPDGFTQVVRLRERHFALSKRVPDEPKLTKPNDPGTRRVPSSMASILSQASTSDGRPVPWADHFVQATREFGVPAGWDFAVFLGVLMSICEQESHFRNVREGGDYDWQPYDQFSNDPRQLGIKREADIRRKYEQTFANAQRNPDNPRSPDSESGVGPMQLTTPGYKVWADEYGWLGQGTPGEYVGGRWNPNSNIRASARALVAKMAIAPPANPNDPNTIWIGVARYHGSTDAAENQAYVTAVKRFYDIQWASVAQTTIAASTSLPTGTQTKIIYNGIEIEVPAGTPDTIKKAINFAEKRLGDPYQKTGGGPRYDCSSFVTAAYAAADPALRALLDEPKPGYHGETTYTLWTPGRFRSITRDSILPGDLLFFSHVIGERMPAEHVGMYLGEGRMIHDPKPGDVVKISSIGTDYYRDHYLGARRLVDWPSPYAAKLQIEGATP